MTMITDVDFQPLSSDLVPWVADPAAHAVAVTVTRVDLKHQPDQVPPTLVGTVQVRVDEVVASARLKPGDLVELPAQQVADPIVRLRNAADAWNVLRLTPGRRWLLMVRIGGVMGRALALAVDEPAAEASAEALQALRAAYELEDSIRARRADAEAFLRAMDASHPTLHRYALDAVVGRMVFGREQGSVLLERALRSPAAKGVRAVEAAGYALRMGLFAGSYGADATNARLLGLIASGLVGEKDRALSLRWTRLLTAATLGELAEEPKRDADLRLRLLRAVRSPTAVEVLQALDKQPLPNDAAGRALLQRLIEVWRAAG